jgi:tetratricopeptide (TPR) repeat protein
MRNIKDARKFDLYKMAIDDALKAECDPELWLLRGNAEEPDASGRGQYGTAASIIYYHHVLTMFPDYASAHHYLAHTYEALGPADSALAHGTAYAELAPAIPHAAHMLGHALRHAGRVKEAVAQFEKADSLERDYYHAENIDPTYDWHHAHNIGLLAAIYKGEELKDVSRKPSVNAARSETMVDLEQKAERARAAGNWDAAESAARKMIDLDPGYGGGQEALARVLEHQGRGEQAALALELSKRLRPKVQPDLNTYGSVSPARAETAR